MAFYSRYWWGNDSIHEETQQHVHYREITQKKTALVFSFNFFQGVYTGKQLTVKICGQCIILTIIKLASSPGFFSRGWKREPGTHWLHMPRIFREISETVFFCNLSMSCTSLLMTSSQNGYFFPIWLCSSSASSSTKRWSPPLRSMDQATYLLREAPVITAESPVV